MSSAVGSEKPRTTPELCAIARAAQTSTAVWLACPCFMAQPDFLHDLCRREAPSRRTASPTLAVLASRPAAGPALAFFQLLLGPANSALSRHLLLRVLDPANELVARQGGEVPPGSECRGVRDERVP